MALNRDQILEAEDRRTEEVQVPEWGGSVLVTSMSGAGRDAWEQSLVVREGKTARMNLENSRARLVAATVVDEAGNRLFDDSDVARLGAKSAAALERVCRVAQRLNALTDAELDDAKGN